MSELITKSPPKYSGPSFKNVSTLVGLIFGTFGLASVFVVALFIPNPTPFQYGVFRSVLALSGAGVAGALPGMLSVDIPRMLKVGGAFVVFGIMYFKTPATIILETVQKIRETMQPRSEEVQSTQLSPQAAASPKVIEKTFVSEAGTLKGVKKEDEFVIDDSEVPNIDPSPAPPRQAPPPVSPLPTVIPSAEKDEKPTPLERPSVPSKLKIVPN